MDWSNERYVRLYTRDTTNWKLLGFEAQSVLVLLLRKADRTGVIEVENLSPAQAAFVHVGAPEDLADRAMTKLLRSGAVEHVDGKLIFPKFIEAQEASMSDAARQREARMRRRDNIRSGLKPAEREIAIYFVQSENGGEIKIGRADDVAKRLAGLQTGRPDRLVLLAAAPGSPEQERALHAHFAEFRVKGEWFMPDTKIMDLIADVAKRGGKAFDFLWSHSVTSHVPLPVTTHEPPVRGHEMSAVTPSLPSVPAVPIQPAVEETPAPAATVVSFEAASRRQQAAAGFRFLVEECGLECWPIGGRWDDAYALIGAKPAEERARAKAVLRVEGEQASLRRLLKPTHVLSYWPDYSQGRRPGQRVELPAGESPGAARVRAVRERHAAEILARRKGSPDGLEYDLDIMRARHLSELTGVQAAVERDGGRGGTNSLGSMLAGRKFG